MRSRASQDGTCAPQSEAPYACTDPESVQLKSKLHGYCATVSKRGVVRDRKIPYNQYSTINTMGLSRPYRTLHD